MFANRSANPALAYMKSAKKMKIVIISRYQIVTLKIEKWSIPPPNIG